jgi:ATP-binding cassette subfamily B protein
MTTRYFIPEVIQTSAEDCGPAALKALFGGFGIYLSYNRLREACQTDDHGTSTEALEDISKQLGMQTVQSVLQPDLILLERTACLPAIVTVRLPDGGSQTVVLWRVHGPWLQVMDPEAGRVFVPRRHFLDSLLIVERPISAQAWEELSTSGAFTAGLEERLRALDLPLQFWSDRAHQDAALRFGGALRDARQLRRGAEARAFLALCAEHPDEIPARFWSVRRGANDDSLTLRGAVLLTARGPSLQTGSAALPESLLQICSEPPPRVWNSVWVSVRESGWRLPTAAGLALCAAACGTVIEALLFRGLFDMGRHLQSTAGRLGLVVALLIFLLTLLAVDWAAVLAQYRLGRQIEWRLRTRFMFKIPRLNDRYFQSRLISDMAFRAHWLQLLRQLPETVGNCLHYGTSILVTGLAIAWIYPGSALLVSLAVVAACAVPVLFLPAMTERDMRYREISAVLGSSYLDCLLGSGAIQAHCAERTLGTVQAMQLHQWARAALRQQVLVVRAEAAQMILTLGFVAALIYQQAAMTQSPAGLLLLIYWSTSIPQLGQEVAKLIRGIPAMRNTLLRFLEMIESPEDEAVVAALNIARADEEDADKPRATGVKIDIEDVSVVAGGHVLLQHVTLHARPGEHIGIVGVSGAGKSSFLGCLLGWHPPATGSIKIDDKPLDAALLAQLRSETAWIDPQVHLFRSSLFENLRYGNGRRGPSQIADAIKSTELERILRYSPKGLQSPIGEGGTLISGGEGQRIRAARALGRTGVRLAILDEPLRGLSRTDRQHLLATARSHFAGATLFCVTHDVSDTLDLDQVLVIEGGRVLEQGPPLVLRANPTSRYNALLAEERVVSQEMWEHPKWRRLKLQAGTLSEVRAAEDPQAMRL